MPRIALLLASAAVLLASVSSVLAADRTLNAVPFTLTETGEPPTSAPVEPTATAPEATLPPSATPGTPWVPPTTTAVPGATNTAAPGNNKKESDEATATPGPMCGTCPKIHQRTANVYTYIDLPILAWPGDCNEVVFTLPARSRVTVVAGPARADGKVWWQIRTAQNQEGWVDESTHINFY